MDFDQDMLDEFVIESKEHIDAIEDDFLALEQQQNPKQMQWLQKM